MMGKNRGNRNTMASDAEKDTSRVLIITNRLSHSLIKIFTSFEMTKRLHPMLDWKANISDFVQKFDLPISPCCSLG